MSYMRPIRPEQSRALPSGQLQLIFVLIGGGVGLVVLLFTNWTSIPVWVRYMIIGFIGLFFGALLVFVITPTSRLLKSRIDSARKTKQQQRNLVLLAGIVQEAGQLLEPHLTCSLRHYVDSLCNMLVQNQSLHPQLKRLAERLHILSNWHGSLLTFADIGFGKKIPFTRMVRDIMMFYRDLSNIVRELASTRLPEDVSTRSLDDNLRNIKAKYNHHMGCLDQILEAISKFNPEIQPGGFHRF